MNARSDLNIRVAYHEAGHAVAAWLLDKPIILVVLPSPEGHHGSVTTDFTTLGEKLGERQYYYAEDADSLWNAAGPTAERIKFGNADCLAEASDENAVHPPERVPEIRALIEETLTRHWPAVEVLAQRLRHPPIRMEGDEVGEIIESALPGVTWTADDKIRLVETVMRWRRSAQK